MFIPAWLIVFIIVVSFIIICCLSTIAKIASLAYISGALGIISLIFGTIYLIFHYLGTFWGITVSVVYIIAVIIYSINHED